LKGIKGVQSVEGSYPDTLTVEIDDSKFTDDALRELVALHYRYGVEMRHLAKFETAHNRGWFRKESTYWYNGVFGDGAI
jgi:hypothetical protein